MFSEKDLALYLTRVTPVDKEAGRNARERLDILVKPQGSLGVLEELAVQLAEIFGSLKFDLHKKANVIFCGDNGIFEEGYNKYPQAISRLVAEVMAAGRGGGTALAGALGVPVKIVDLGLKGSYGGGAAVRNSVHRGPGPGQVTVKEHKICPQGTANMSKGPALSRDQVLEAMGTGIREAEELLQAGVMVLSAGEIGLGNTSTAAAVLSVLTGLDSAAMTGIGSGSVGEAYQRKVEAVARSLAVNRPVPEDVPEVLAKVGGLDIAAMTGFYLACARHRRPAVLDGYISFAAALCAEKLCPAAGGYLIASHLSEEKGAALAAKALAVDPPLQLGMRLGEGTGAVLLFPLLDAAGAVLQEMATFEDLALWFPDQWPPETKEV